MTVTAAPGTVVLYTDVVCAWSTVALHRFYAARSELGLDDRLRVDHRLFLLEDVNRFAIPERMLDAEIPVVGRLEPGLGMSPWEGEPSAWPVTALPADEAVHAAKQQSAAAAEQLDMALRLAFFRDSRCISMLHEVVDVARDCDLVDAGAIAAALDDGRARAAMMADYRAHRADVQGSPHFFLADGSDVHNPGIAMHADEAGGYPVVDSDDPSAYEDLVRRAAAAGSEATA
ncbi:putative DsbA family dithiol-disulfide isomerase [Blastococcus colisei]|uniref:Putative DsbA family dithiol-disulfide isomerase n=1 Tax=Blastococcus colisei TaxID=1564162 RepID=A0A543PEJ0_9ACTN|nr:DsbA family protein [Blastococcus colisei]TQN42514.1 putative DsbA family dithiol-disulfide isomerase [Blastococcus colisei]